jgi:hypothetical protein
VHVLGPADHAQLGHGLVGGDDQLHARPAGVHQALARRRVDSTAGAVDGLVLGLGHSTHQAEGSGAGAAPHQRRLAPGGVVGQGLAGVVVGPVQHRVAVVGHRVRTHHPHPRHGLLPKPQA